MRAITRVVRLEELVRRLQKAKQQALEKADTGERERMAWASRSRKTPRPVRSPKP